MQNHQIQKIALLLGLGLLFSLSAQAEAILGECGRYMGNKQQSCKSGTFHHHPSSTATEFRWSCRNIPYDGEIICSESKFLTEFAECGQAYWGPYDASCDKGVFHPHPGHSATEFRWTCRNIPHNGEVQCSLPRADTKKEKEEEEEEKKEEPVQLPQETPEPKPKPEPEPELETTEEESAAAPPVEAKAPVLQTSLLTTLSNDYKSEEALDLMVVTNAQNHIVSIQTKKHNENKAKTYPAEKLKERIPLLKLAGITLIQFQCFGFSPENGCTIQIEYPYSIAHGSYRQFRAQLKLKDGKWGLYQDDRHLLGLHMVINRWWGFVVGIKELHLR